MPAQPIVQACLTSLRQRAGAPNATEHSYRPPIETLIKDLAQHHSAPRKYLCRNHIYTGGESCPSVFTPHCWQRY